MYICSHEFLLVCTPVRSAVGRCMYSVTLGDLPPPNGWRSYIHRGRGGMHLLRMYVRTDQRLLIHLQFGLGYRDKLREDTLYPGVERLLHVKSLIAVHTYNGLIIAYSLCYIFFSLDSWLSRSPHAVYVAWLPTYVYVYAFMYVCIWVGGCASSTPQRKGGWGGGIMLKTLYAVPRNAMQCKQSPQTKPYPPPTSCFLHPTAPSHILHPTSYIPHPTSRVPRRQRTNRTNKPRENSPPFSFVPPPLPPSCTNPILTEQANLTSPRRRRGRHTRATNTSPDIIMNALRQLPATKSLINKPQADHKPIPIQHASTAAVDEGINRSQRMIRQPRATPDLANNKVTDHIAVGL